MHSQNKEVTDFNKKHSLIKTCALLLPMIAIDLLMSFPIPMVVIFGGFFVVAFMNNGKNILKVLAIYFATILILAGIYQVRYKMTVDNGNEIVTALAKYKEKNNTYPRELKELTPESIDNIPRSWSWTFNWEYHYFPEIFPKKDYKLYFNMFAVKKCSYNHKNKTWRCFD